MPLIVLPDIELMVLKILRADEELMALVPGGVHKKMAPPFPMLRVTRFGGAQDIAGWRDAARVQLDAWDEIEANGGSEFRARKVAATASAVLVSHAQGAIDDIGIFDGADEIIGPTPERDPDTKRPRYLVDLRVYAHPIPA